MKIVQLELKGYKRLSLNNINRFIMTPTDRVQIIIGTNGSGKSSVLRELSPLPASHQDYHVGGSKTIVLSHQGTEYTLISDFTKGQRHSFLKDNSEELNIGGTFTVQKELVKKTFGYDSVLHDLMLGNTTFTQMSVQQRREFLTDLSGGDLDYALGVFKRIKTAHRDTQGIVRHLEGKLVSLTAKKLQDKDIEEIQSYVRLLQNELTILMQNSQPFESSFLKKWEEVLEATNVWKDLSSKLLASKPYYFGKHPAHYPTLGDSIAATNEDIATEKGHVEFLLNEVHSVKELLTSLNDMHATTLDGVKRHHAKLVKKKCDLFGLIRQFRNIPQASLVVGANKVVGENIETLIGNIPNNQDGWFSLQRLNENKTILERLDERMVIYKKEQQRIQNHIDNCRQTDPIKCHNCGYKWIPGFEAEQEAFVMKELDRVSALIESNEKERAEALDIVVRITDYQQSLKVFKNFMDQFPILKPLWDKIIDEKILTRTPSLVLTLFKFWVEESEIHADIEKCDREIDESKDTMEYVLQHEDEGGSVFLMNGKLEDLENQLEKSIQTHASLTQNMKSMKEAQQAAHRFRGLMDEWEKSQEHMRVVFNEYADAYRDHLIKRTISEHQNDLAQNNAVLTDALIAGKEIDSTKSALAVQLDEQKAFKILMDVLSPVDGLIAEQLKGFLEHFVNQMNNVVDKVWTYPLLIKPCGFESGELDYKFPMLVGTDSYAVPDVALGSGAQKDIVNFAFKLAVVAFKGMTDYPLYLDELAPTLDEKHRINITRYVHDYTDAHMCSQLFMISHYQPSYGAFSNADVCIMDSTNMLNIPHVYNRHVLMD